MKSPPVLIIGQGLAGTSLAWRLHERGVPFLIIDRDEPVTASKIAAGLVTPITGMRLTASWRYETLYPQALRFYRRQEKILARKFYHVIPLVRLLGDESAIEKWAKRLTQPEVHRYLRVPAPQPLVDSSIFSSSHGGFEQKHSGWLDTAAFLSASRSYFEAAGLWRRGQVAPEELCLKEGRVEWNDRLFSCAIFCTGWEAANQRWFDWVPFQSARGTVLTVQADTRGERRIINRNCWLLPRADGTLRVGPTYELPFDDPHVASPKAIAGLEKKLQALLKIPYQITGSQTAVRPIIKGREALIGRHPARPQIAFMNGLGSKGVLRAPWLAGQLVAHLLDGKPIESELDLAGNL